MDGAPTDILRTPLRIGAATIPNRLYRAPVLEGAGDGAKAVDVYTKTFVPNAEHCTGLIIQGSSCIYEEGRTSPGMTLVNTREKMLRFAPMTEAVHRAGGTIFLQLGHGGLFAMEGWHHPYCDERKAPLRSASGVPPWLKPVFRGVPVEAPTTAEVYEIAHHYGEAAAWAREAGYDGVQLGSSNAKLLHQFLSPFYNRRDDEFGGSVENRARILRLAREAMAERAGADFPVSVKVPVGEKAPWPLPRSSFNDGVRTCALVAEWGFDAVTPVEVSVFPDTALTRGGIPKSMWQNPAIRTRFEKAAPEWIRQRLMLAGYVGSGLRYPFRPAWNRRAFVAAKAAVDIPVFAVGGIRSAEDVRSILAAGEADMVGIGRPFYAEPDLGDRILGDDPAPRRCQNSNFCVPPQQLGMKGGCYNPAVEKVRLTPGRAAAGPATD